MKSERSVEIAIVGAGIAGIATAYYLCTRYGKRSVLLIDRQQPMSFTSAQSGDNYRNWWPHPTMVAFTNRSIDLMEEIAKQTSNIFNMTRRGYLLATRQQNIDDLIADLYTGYGERSAELVRVRDASSQSTYRATLSNGWQSAPDGVDVLTNPTCFQPIFPALADDTSNLIHIRKAGDIDSQQLAAFMLQRIRETGGKRLAGIVKGMSRSNRFEIDVDTADGLQAIVADITVNAAGPFAGDISAMMDVDLPIQNIFQQKLAFEDRFGAVPRDLPFTVDLDETDLGWTDEDRQLIAAEPDFAWLAKALPGGRHCRPVGNEHGKWVKLGWAYNSDVSEPREDLANERQLDERFPEIVIRGAAALIPALGAYIASPPERFSLFGGYYTMTEENWPLIGPLGVDGAFAVCALSGFGSMAACAAGADCAAWVCDGDLPGYAHDLSLMRYSNPELLDELRKDVDKGLL